MTHANGVTTTYQYDAASQLLSLVRQLDATTINSFSYTYDKVGNRKTKADNNGTANYAYDTLNRLVQATNPLPSNPLESFTYDAVGNRVDSNQNGLSTFNAANQLEEDAGFNYLYDNNGNLIQKTNKTTGAFTLYEYDAENKLIRVVLPNGDVVKYEYDALGRRVEKKVYGVGGGSYVNYVYDNEDILLEVVGLGGAVGFELQAKYTHGPGIDEPLIIEKDTDGDFVPDTSFFYHADGLGSITELTDAAGTTVQSYSYSSFGKIESQLDPNFIQPYTFTSREFDPETNLYYYRARYYDASVGRFLQRDLFKGNITAPPSLNLYPYVANNPTNSIDPSGRIVFNLAAAGIGAAIGGTIGGITAALNGDNIWVGVGVGAGAGALSGLTLGLGSSVLLGAVAGGGGNVVSQVANDLLAGRSVDVDILSAIVSGAAGAIGATAAAGVSQDLLKPIVGGTVAGITDFSGLQALDAVRERGGVVVSPSEVVLLPGGICS